MDLLVAGASGFMGRNLLAACPGDWNVLALYCHDASFPAFVAGLNNPNIHVGRCDLHNPNQVSAVLDGHGREWDACVHLAAKVDIPASVRSPREDLFANAGSLINVLEHLRADRLVYFSSGAVYDGLRGEAVPSAKVAPTLPYAISKLACERYVEFYASRRRTIRNALIVRFFGAYGPYEASHKIYTRLIRRFAVEQKNSFTLYGGGTNLIDAMHVTDAVDAVLRMLAGDHWNDTINLAAGAPMTIRDLVAQTGAALGLSEVHIENEGVAHEANEFWGSTAEMRRHYRFEPRIGLQDGIRSFRDFILQNDLTKVNDSA